MIREEAIDIIKCLAWHTRPNEEDIEQAIEALEQEPILDKIREIVDEWQSDSWTDNLSYECMIKIAEILDKYKAESEASDE